MPEDEPKPPLKAPDGGWSWVVLVAVFYTALIIIGIPLTFGVVFNEKLTILGVSSTTMAWIYNLYCCNFFISSALCGPLCDVFGWRSVGFVSSIIAGLAYALLTLASTPGLIFLLFSVVVGCSAGLCAQIPVLIIPHYFDKHRGRAAAIFMTGSAISQIIIPLLMRRLQDEYGFNGASLIFAGLIFNCAVGNLLFYPVRKRPLLKGDKIYEATGKARYPKSDKPEGPNSDEESKGKPTNVFEVFITKLNEFLRTTWLNVCKLQRMPLLILMVSFAFFNVGYGNFGAVLPFAMAVHGHPAADISYSFSIGAAANTAVRIFISWASDARWFSRKIAYIFGAALSGAASLATGFVLHDKQLIIICQIFWGIGLGANLGVLHILIIDTCGRELYDAGVSIGCWLLAICSITVGPLIGVARDYSSYVVALCITAVLQLACALLWIFMPLAQRHDLKKFPQVEDPDRKLDKKTKKAIKNFTQKLEAAGYVNNGYAEESGQSSEMRERRQSLN